MSTPGPSPKLRALLAESLRLVRHESPGHELEADLGRVAGGLAGCGPSRRLSPRGRPASDRWLATACALADAPAARVAGALLAASPELDWYTPYDPHTAPARFRPFIDGYACAMLCGEPRPHGARPAFDAPGLLFAFSVQAPGLHYPPHNHPARELYRVLGGTGAWWREGEDWLRRAPGSWLAHEHFQAHAMKSGDQPLLSVAIWVDHLDGSAALTG